MTAAHRRTTRSRLRVVLYGRVSSDRKGEKTSVDAQMDGLRDDAKRQDWRVVAEHRDDDVGASPYSRKEREAWPKVRELIETGQVDILAVRSLSRASRDRMVYAALIHACITHGVLLAIGGKVYDPADPDDAFALDIEAAFAVRGAGTISKDTRDGKAKAAARGRPAGRATWLHRRVYDEQGVLVRVELHEDRAAALREAAAFVLAGGSLTQAARDVNAKGLGREFGRLTLRKTLISPSTAGLRELNGVIVGKAMWPSAYAVDGDDGEATYRQLVTLLTQPDRRVTSSGVLQHLTTGIALCGHSAHGPLTNRARPVMIGTGSKNRARIECSGDSTDPENRHYTSTLRAPVDDYVWAVLVERMSRADALELWSNARSVATPATVGPTARELEDQLTEWEAAAVAGTLTPDAFGRIEAGIREKIAKAKADAKARTAEVPTVLRDLAAADDVPAAMEALPIGRRRELLQVVGAPVVLPGYGPVEDRVKFPWELHPRQ
jgi:site-specific DNA recombinase